MNPMNEQLADTPADVVRYLAQRGHVLGDLANGTRGEVLRDEENADLLVGHGQSSGQSAALTVSSILTASSLAARAFDQSPRLANAVRSGTGE